jgi:hypothetical protein
LYELLFVEDKIIHMDSTFLPSEGEKSIGDHTNQNIPFENWIFGPDGTKLKRGKSMGNLGG